MVPSVPSFSTMYARFKWRYRRVSCALCTAIFVTCLMVIHTSPYNERASNRVDYEETPYELTEHQTETLREHRREYVKTSEVLVRNIKNIVAYSLETELEMERKGIITCPNTVQIPFQADINTQSKFWQNPLNSSLYLYSAHLDTRVKNHTFVRILAMQQTAPSNQSQTYFCQVWFAGQPLVVEALVVDIWLPHWDQNPRGDVSTPVLLSCEIDHRELESAVAPTGVSVNVTPCGQSSTLLPINPVRSNSTNTFTVCVKGMDFEADLSGRLIEWFEMNRVLGADKFFIYVYRVHENMRRVLEFYETKGIATVIPLTRPPYQHKDTVADEDLFIHKLWQKRRNEIIPYNDCYYRNLYTSQFVIPLDIDEFLLPVRHDTWGEVFQDLTKDDPEILSKVSSFSVKNAYFFDIFPEEPHENLHIMRHLTRSANFSHGEESVKSFVSTSTALLVFNHFTFSTLSPGIRRNMVLDTGRIQMNHYKRDCDPQLVQDCENFRNHRRRDELVIKYRDKLSDRVTEARRYIFLALK